MRLAVVTSHPVQYQAPLFRALAERVDLRVYFAHRATQANQARAGFGVGFDWDSDVTGGFGHTFLNNVSANPNIVHYEGCDTPEIGAVLAADRPDAVVVFGWHFKSYLQTAQAARRLGIPVLARTDSHLGEPRPWAKRMVKSFAYPVFLRRFDAFLPVGVRSAAYLRHYRVPEERIHVVPYCVDTTAFQSSAQAAQQRRSELRASLGASDDDLVLLFVGKLIERKRACDVLDAAHELQNAGRNIRVVLVGSGPLEAALRAQATALDVPVTFTGFVNQTRLPELYAAADLLVLPSDNESWGLCVNEAFACGLPAIVSDRVGCAPDMIREGLTGNVFPVGESESLARAIEAFTLNTRTAAVQAALRDMTERYSPERSAKATAAAVSATTRGSADMVARVAP